MKAITLWQPWAQWVAEGFKMIETRTHDRFKNQAGKRIAIHAALKIDDKALQLAEKWATKEALSAVSWGGVSKLICNRGVILCTVTVDHVGWLDESHSAAAMIDCQTVRRFGLFLTDVKKLENPIPYKGQQGIFEWEEIL
jgi:hypothetical protein